MITFVVDGKEIRARKGESLLHACLDNGIYIPNLCAMRGMKDFPASCRLCFVEIEGVEKPVASCNQHVREEMVVRTDTKAVRRLQKSALRLILSAHNADCCICPSNRNCDLQRMARHLGVLLKPKNLEHLDRGDLSALNHPYLDYFPSRCVLCGKCVYVCAEKNDRLILTFAKRGFDTVVAFFGKNDSDALSCAGCMECVSICPVSALLPKSVQDESASNA